MDAAFPVCMVTDNLWHKNNVPLGSPLEVVIRLPILFLIFELLFLVLSSLSPCSSLMSDHRLHHSRPVMFSIGANPPLSPDLSTDFKQPVAATSHCFSHFFTTFIATNPHIHPGLTFLPFRSPFFLMSPGLLLTNQ